MAFKSQLMDSRQHYAGGKPDWLALRIFSNESGNARSESCGAAGTITQNTNGSLMLEIEKPARLRMST
jgi:hypothetical protein